MSEQSIPRNQQVNTDKLNNGHNPKSHYNFFYKISPTLGKLTTTTLVQTKLFLTPKGISEKGKTLKTKLSKNISSDKSKSYKKTSGKKSKEQQEKDELKKFIKKSNEVLASATTVFPFTLFPDTIVVDRTKVTITQRSFFFTSNVLSIRVEDIFNVRAIVGPFFGSLTIAGRILNSEDHYTINFFSRRDAIHLKHLLQGYVIAQHNNIQTSHLNKTDLIKTLAELGHDANM